MNEEDSQQLRDELLILAAKKEIPYKESYIKKVSEKTLVKIYEDVKRQQLHETNEMLTDLAIGKLSELLFTLGWIESTEETGMKLQHKKLFRADVCSLISKVSPYIPFVWILEGGITIAEDVAKNTVKNYNQSPVVKTEDD